MLGSPSESIVVVTLFTRVWIEIIDICKETITITVTLFTRVWIEIVWTPNICYNRIVTLFTRVWIEIIIFKHTLHWYGSHSLYESVNWNFLLFSYICLIKCHSLYESVNWNFLLLLSINSKRCHSLYESVNWNLSDPNDENARGESLSLRECELKWSLSTQPIL